jgi:hypothetical protein
MGIVSPTGGAFRRQPTTSPSSLVSGIAEQRITFTIASANPGVHRLLAGVGNLLGPQSSATPRSQMEYLSLLERSAL